MTTLFSNAPTIVSSNRILYTASSFARSSLLHLQEVGELHALAPHTSSRSNLNSYLFFTVVSGSGVLEYAGKCYELSSGSCVFIDCANSYSHTTDHSLWTLRWIHFNGPTMGSVYQKYKERGGQPTFTPGSTEEVDRIWNVLMDVAGSADYMRDMKINSYLSDLLVSVMECSWHPEEQKKGKKRSSVSDVKEWIDSHFQENVTLNQLSREFYINKYYLAKTFKAQFGQTVNAYLTTVRITKAKQMLRFTDQTLDEIGEAVGITPGRYLSEVFSSVEGVSPREYRKQW